METIKVVNVCDVLAVIFGEDWASDFYRTYDETQAAIMGWCEANDAHYYARPREDFSRIDALAEARSVGKTTVVVEDLS